MSYRVEYRASVDRDLRNLPRAVQQRVATKILALADESRPTGCVKLTGYSNLYRLRVGDYRIVYEVHDKDSLVIIVLVAHRREVYRDL